MPKRLREDSPLALPSTKRSRTVITTPVDRLSSMSNELLLHILSFLPISSLNVCQRLSRRFHALGGDSELWKRQYYSQWVRPRARRLANVRRSILPSKAEYSPKVSTWFDHGHLAAEGRVTNWKRQYRLRHNWASGSCRVTEVEFIEPPCPPVLVKLCSGIVFTADTAHGLRGWAAKDPTRCLCKVAFPELRRQNTRPTALSVSQLENVQEIVVGFEDGHFDRYALDVATSQLKLLSSHLAFSDGAITAMALSSPYLLIVSQHKLLSLYNLQGRSGNSGDAQDTTGPCEIASLRAENMVAPMTLSLRVSANEIVATIVYSFFHIGCGWSSGIQELRFAKDGQQLESRLTSTVDSQYGTRLLRGHLQSNQRLRSTSDSTSLLVPTEPSIMHQRPPTSMSYNHPYLLTSHADNTLTMYLVVSDSDRLFVRGGQRLWGHTSSVSTVLVTNRGKAVSVSSLGNEIRIWELETAVSSLNSHRSLKEESSIQVSPDNRAAKSWFDIPKSTRKELSGSELVTSTPQPLDCMYECVGFDEERVLLLGEKTVGTQLLECYDFT
ncbi:hypothetical protein N7478_007985 [Penicillium angulare]|uniref:uncharacterized protein n=1 Tax=Penicillium angulare TaxID=116970 RepID=UPI00253F7676|nr:uncharacterized protein N7478_007985 [Penicillium angulare]KAJ5272860.1 hypothetical protein N7478_007985 [Penicillium angulare]